MKTFLGFRETVNAFHRLNLSKHMAPKEPMHDVTSDPKKGGNRKAVKVSQKQIEEGNKANKLKKRDWQDPKKRSKKDEKWDPRDTLSAGRRGRKVAEETLSELKKDTLKSYIKKAGDQRVAHSQSYETLSNQTGYRGYATKDEMKKGGTHLRKMKNRREGIGKALDRLEEAKRIRVRPSFRGSNEPYENTPPKNPSPALKNAMDRITAAFPPGSIKVGGPKTVKEYQEWPGSKKKKFFSGPKDKNGKTETQKWAEKKQAERDAAKKAVTESIKDRQAFRKRMWDIKKTGTTETGQTAKKPLRDMAAKALKKKEMRSEETINEISRKLAGEYLKKSAHNQYDLAVKHKKATGKERLDLGDKIERRREGQKLAILKRGARVQATEETLDEISQRLAGRYRSLAGIDLAHRTSKALTDDQANRPVDKENRKKRMRRVKGIQRADKYFKEETLDEVSRKKAFAAYAGTQDPDRDDDDGLYKTGERLKGHIKKKWGKEGVSHAERHAFATHFGRGKKNVKEEQIDEVSKELALRYFKKSAKDWNNHKIDGSMSKDEMDTKARKGYNRATGMGRAAKKVLSKEETINEISHKLALKAMKKSERLSDKEYEADNGGDWQGHEDRANRLRKHMRKKFGNDKPGRGNTEGDPLDSKDEYGGRSHYTINTHGKRAGLPSKEHFNRLKNNIRYNLGKHKKANLPEGFRDSVMGAINSVNPLAKAGAAMAGSTPAPKQDMRIMGNPDSAKKPVKDGSGDSPFPANEEFAGMRQMKQKITTKVNNALGVEKDQQTILVKDKNVPGGKPHRIAKNRFDPSKHIKV